MQKKQYIKKVDYIFSECDCKAVLKSAMEKGAEKIINDLIDSGLRGRGGAGFPIGLKWKFAAAEKGDKKYLICNADEGEPGTFKDREILTEVPVKVFTGMALGSLAFGADEGIIYLRSEYKYLLPHINKHIEKFTKQILEPLGIKFKIYVFPGSGAYVCGEETALIESMEGKRGEPRNKPPYPIQNGYLGKPTVVNNVETLASSVIVMRIGTEAYKNLGTDDQRGSKLFSVSGDSPKEGVYEIELGMSVADFVEEFGDGDTKAVQVGGVSGFCIPRKNFHAAIIGEGNTTGGSTMVFNSSRSMYNVLHNFLEFYAEESCGQCTPCRVGCQQLLNGIEYVKKGEKPENYLDQLIKLSKTMKITSKCGLGQSVTNSFESIVDNFREEMMY